MADQAFEAIGVGGDPINHVAAVGATGSAYARAIYERIFGNGSVEAFHEVVVNFAAPVAADFGCKFLAVAGGAAGIDHYDYVSGRGHHLLVPAIAPRIGPGALRSAVDQEQRGIFFCWIEIRRTDQQAFYLRFFGTFEPEGFGGGES